MDQEIRRAQTRGDGQHRLVVADLGFRVESKYFHVEHFHAGRGEPILDSRHIHRVLVWLPRHRNQAQADEVVAHLRRHRDLLLRRKLEDGERRKTDLPAHAASLRKCASMRAASASRPVNSLKPRIAWPTFMWPPSAVAQPARRAALSSSVSIGT